MSELNDKLIEAVVKLIQLTQENKIVWSSNVPKANPIRDDEQYIETVFLARHDNKNLRLYSRDYKVEENLQATWFSSITGTPRPKWRTTTTLEIIDDNYNTIWTFPQLAPLSDLLMSVRYQVADVDDFIEGLLADSDNESSDDSDTKLLNE